MNMIELDEIYKQYIDTKQQIAEETRRANLAKLEAELSEARQKLDIEKRTKIQDIEEEFNNRLYQLEAEYKAKRAEFKA